jgi:translation elongation factor EF-Tu-like GTPase
MKTFESVDNHELEGNVYLIPSEFGGRESAVHSGYRGQFFWHINNESGTDWLAESYFENDLVEPGQSARIKIRLAATILNLGRITGMPTGRQFALREGSRIVAVGIITHSKFETAEHVVGGNGG